MSVINDKAQIGTVGLGLMGCSIATCLLIAGHKVTSLVQHIQEAPFAKKRILKFLNQSKDEGLLKEEPETVIQRLVITDKIKLLANHEIVIEAITEKFDQKVKLYHRLESILSSTAIIGSNTSAIPISILQRDLKHPDRLIGIHWGEPAHVGRFLEVICGEKSNSRYAAEVMAIAEKWGKEPALVKKDIRGFISNRLMYAMMREAFHLVGKGYASYEDIDRACRNDFGYWITLAGPFRYMDITGIPAYLDVIKELFPELDNSAVPPAFMEVLVESGARGISNMRGFYNYTEDTSEAWEKVFNEFSYEIRKLSIKYPQNLQQKKDE